MTLYSYITEYPITKIPEMITLSDGSTRTDSSTFTSDELLDAGYVEVSNPPDYDQKTHKLVWTGTEWQIISLTESEIIALNDREWQSIRKIREEKIKTVEWRIMRNLSETRQGITTTTDNIADLDAYVQALRDITTSITDPFEVVWPSIGPLSSDENTPSP